MITNIVIRLADNSEGHIVEKLTNENGFTLEGLDWTTIFPYWLVAVNENEIIGTIQVSQSRPVGRLELLSIKPNIDHRLRALTVKRLLLAGCASLKEGGAQMSMGMIPFEMKSYKKLLKKRGSIIVSNGNLMAKRL